MKVVGILCQLIFCSIQRFTVCYLKKLSYDHFFVVKIKKKYFFVITIKSGFSIATLPKVFLTNINI